MLTTLAIQNYRSLLKLVMPLGRLNVITGPNGSGKSNLYRALRLLAETAQGGITSALAREGGLQSTLWAGPEKISTGMRKGVVPVQGVQRKEAVRLRLGYASKELSYAIALGLPPPPPPSAPSMFSLDPEIKSERIWAGPVYRPAATLIDRTGALIKARGDEGWRTVAQNISAFESIFNHVADPNAAPEVFYIRELIRGWRFYDHFRTDRDAPARQPQLGTRTPVLHHDGCDLAAAWQTIREIGDTAGLDDTISDAFPGSRVEIEQANDGRLGLVFHQHGLLRPLSSAELSDGTLRFLLWVAALLTPRPPSLMVLNEPETSLHPDLLPALARLIVRTSEQTQIWVVSHAAPLIAELKKHPTCHSVELERCLGQTEIKGQERLDAPPWQWPDQ
jgi:predicted ATPase